MTPSHHPPEITLDRLPVHSPWPSRLLGLDPWQTRTKSREEVLREFEQDRWGALLAKLRSQPEIRRFSDALSLATEEAGVTPAFDRGRLILLPVKEAALQLYAQVADAVLQEHSAGQTIVDLGAGWGGVLLTIASRARKTRSPFVGAELTESGRQILTYLASVEDLPVTAVACDFLRRPVMDPPPPPGAIVFTSYALHYLEPIDPSLFDEIASWRPALVLHFEPCLDHYPTDSLLGLMQRRYVTLNGYSTTILSALLQAQRRGVLELEQAEGPIFGTNALLPYSLLTWRPARRADMGAQ